MQGAGRLHYMDNLRALAMLAGVVFHAALAYSPMAQPFFPTADRDGSAVVDLLAWFVHLFRMPLFFVVAGFFAAMLVDRRGMGGMLRNRLLRVGLPFVVGVPLVHWAMSASTLHAAASVAHPSPVLALIRGWMEAPGGLPPHPPGTSHLWFLYYLLVFYVLAWCVRSLGAGAWGSSGPAPGRHDGSGDAPARMGRMRAALRHPLGQLLLWPLLLVPALASVGAPHPAPESLLPQFWALGFFGPFFAFGYLAHGNAALLERHRVHAPWLLVGSVLAYAVFLSGVAARPMGGAGADAQLAIAVAAALVSVWMTSVCLAWGSRLLARASSLLRYLADASYWSYIVHLPVLFAVQYRLMDMESGWLAKFAVSLLATLLACLVSYEVLVRRTVLARVLGAGAARVRCGARRGGGLQRGRVAVSTPQVRGGPPAGVGHDAAPRAGCAAPRACASCRSVPHPGRAAVP